MKGRMKVLHSFSPPVALAPWLVAWFFVLAACESSQIPAWMQGDTPALPQPVAPPPAAAELPPRQAVPEPTAEPAPPAEARDAPTGVPSPRRPPEPAPAAEPPSLVPYLTSRLPAATESPAPVLTPPPSLPSSVNRVALLLPLTGFAAEIGEHMLDAAQMALFDFADDRFEFIIHDTRGTPEGAADAAALAIGDGASLILGPLLAPSVRAVAPAARAAGLNVIAFSNDRSVAGDGVFTMGFFPDAEVDRVVAYARSRGLSRFAALAPDTEYGRTVTAALRRAAPRVGAVVTQIELYDPNAGEFSATVKRLARYESRRSALAAQQAELRGREDEIAKRALARLQQLETIGGLSFDALLLADGGKRLQALAAFLPFYDVDPANIRMLGTWRWDAPDVGAEPALVGGWYAAPPPDARADFERRYARTYGRPPHRLATLAYDAAALAAVLARGEPDFSAAALTAPGGFAGAAGIFRFLPEGAAERRLTVLEVGPRGDHVISKAPETFGALTN